MEEDDELDYEISNLAVWSGYSLGYIG